MDASFLRNLPDAKSGNFPNFFEISGPKVPKSAKIQKCSYFFKFCMSSDIYFNKLSPMCQICRKSLNWWGTTLSETGKWL